MPSRMSSRMRVPAGLAAGSASCARILALAAAPTRNEPTSTTTAYAAPRAPTSSPPMLGPANWAKAPVEASLPLPSTSWSGPTTTGR